jgi:hypothetical protein
MELVLVVPAALDHCDALRPAARQRRLAVGAAELHAAQALAVALQELAANAAPAARLQELEQHDFIASSSSRTACASRMTSPSS